MDVYELRYPGTQVVGLEDGVAHSVTSLVSLMESGVAEAAVSLHFFEEACRDTSGLLRGPSSPDEWKRRRKIEQAIEQRLLNGITCQPHYGTAMGRPYLGERRSASRGEAPVMARRRMACELPASCSLPLCQVLPLRGGLCGPSPRHDGQRTMGIGSYRRHRD